MMLFSITIAKVPDKLRCSRNASLSLLFVLLSGYGANLYLDNDELSSTLLQRRSLQEKRADPPRSRILAKSGVSPPTTDEIPGQYIIKPWVGNAATDVWEDLQDAKLTLASAQASNVQSSEYAPRNAIDDPNLLTRWSSSQTNSNQAEWVNIDLGGPKSVGAVYIKWETAHAADYDIQVAFERPNCRSDGEPCPDAWIDVASITGKSNADATTDYFDGAPQGVRYVRVRLTKRAPGFTNFSIYYIRVFRKRMIIGSTPTNQFCGATIIAVSNYLLNTYGRALIQSYENAEFFSASLTEAQKDAMFEDSCVFTVEPNYILKARSRTMGSATTRRLGGSHNDKQERRRLAIPEFNLRDENPPSELLHIVQLIYVSWIKFHFSLTYSVSLICYPFYLQKQDWGLERISSHGKLNGKYTWFHEG